MKRYSHLFLIFFCTFSTRLFTMCLQESTDLSVPVLKKQIAFYKQHKRDIQTIIKHPQESSLDALKKELAEINLERSLAHALAPETAPKKPIPACVQVPAPRNLPPSTALIALIIKQKEAGIEQTQMNNQATELVKNYFSPDTEHKAAEQPVKDPLKEKNDEKSSCTIQ